MAETDQVGRVVASTLCKRLDVVNVFRLDESSKMSASLTERIDRKHLVADDGPLIVVVPRIDSRVSLFLVVFGIHQPSVFHAVSCGSEFVASWISARFLWFVRHCRSKKKDSKVLGLGVQNKEGITTKAPIAQRKVCLHNFTINLQRHSCVYKCYNLLLSVIYCNRLLSDLLV